MKFHGLLRTQTEKTTSAFQQSEDHLRVIYGNSDENRIRVRVADNKQDDDIGSGGSGSSSAKD